MPAPFSPTAALGIAPRPYADYFQDGDDPETPTFKGIGYSAPNMLASPITTPFDLASVKQGVAEQQYGLEQRQRQLAAEQEMAQGGTDWSSDEGQAHLQDMIAQGLIDPQHARAIEYAQSVQNKASKQGALNKYSPVKAAVVQAAAPLETIDPSDPTARQQLNQTLQDIDNNPDYAGTNVRAHPYFAGVLKGVQNKIEAFQMHRLALGGHDPDQKMMLDAAQKGVDPDVIHQFTDETHKKVIDPLGLAKAAFDVSRGAQALTVDAKKNLNTLAAQALAASKIDPTPDQKSAWLAQQGIDPASASLAQWGQAWTAVKNAPYQKYSENYDMLNESTGHSPKMPQKIQLGNAPVAQPAALPAGVKITKLN